MPVNCSVCGGESARPLWLGWVRCDACGSDTSPLGYDPAIYDERFADQLSFHRDHGALDHDGQRREMTVNLDWIARLPVPDLSILDAGCAWGVSRLAPQLAGWRWHGWDVAAYSGQDASVTVSQHPPYVPPVGAVMLREVIEHVPYPRDLLGHLRELTLPGAYLQVQTPRPMPSIDAALYEPQHLRIYSTEALAGLLWASGWCVRERLDWDRGQCVVARRISLPAGC